jgi:hypothetical protein
MANLIMKQWVSEIDGRTTIVCLNAAGQTRKPDQPFDTLNGQFDAPPAHVHCRALVSPYLIGAVNTLRDKANAELQNRPLSQRDPRKMKMPPKPKPKATAPKRRRKVSNWRRIVSRIRRRRRP